MTRCFIASASMEICLACQALFPRARALDSSLCARFPLPQGAGGPLTAAELTSFEAALTSLETMWPSRHPARCMLRSGWEPALRHDRKGEIVPIAAFVGYLVFVAAGGKGGVISHVGKSAADRIWRGAFCAAASATITGKDPFFGESRKFFLASEPVGNRRFGRERGRAFNCRPLFSGGRIWLVVRPAQ
jgi:hypothetical protein